MGSTMLTSPAYQTVTDFHVFLSFLTFAGSISVCGQGRSMCGGCQTVKTACALMIHCHKLHGHCSHTYNPRNTSGLTVQKKPNCPLLNDAVPFVLTYVEVMVKLCMVFF